MTRRIALALALALTTVVTFAVVATGQEVGLFDGSGGGSQAAELQESTPTPTIAPAAEPSVTTEYIYVDETSTPSGSQPSDDGALPSPSASPSTVSGDDDGEHDDGEHDDGEHDDGEHDDGEHDDGD